MKRILKMLIDYSDKKNINLKITFLLSLLFFVNSYAEEDHSHHGHSQGNHAHSSSSTKMNMHKGKKKLTDSEQKQVIASLEIYEKLHQSYFDYDSKKVKKNSQELLRKLKSISNKDLVTTLEKNNVFKFLEAIKDGENRSLNNSLLDNISKKLNDHVLAKYDLGGVYNYYHCPMVKKNWIQNTKKMAEIHNPYAPEMPHCGSQETKY